jgi:hypothetical protein
MPKVNPYETPWSGGEKKTTFYNGEKEFIYEICLW